MITDETPRTGFVNLQLWGLSSDVKPTEEYGGAKIANGSKYYEIDTANVYMYDEENATWYLQ